MKAKWSSAWKGSKQPRKQRKYRFNAPLHIRHAFLSAHLAPELRAAHRRRSMPLRTGDEVRIARGPLRGTRKVVERVDLRRGRVYLEGVKVKKVNGTEVLRPLQPSNLIITKLTLADKARLAAVQRGKGEPDRAAKPEAAKKKLNQEARDRQHPAAPAAPHAHAQDPQAEDAGHKTEG